jgi:hypothetical protein
MKKQYRLIKKYPDSPTLDSIYEQIIGPCGNGSGTMFKNINKDGCCLDSTTIINNPEFWQKVIELPIGTKAYNSRTDSTYTKRLDGWYMSSKTAYTDKSISASNWIVILDDQAVDKNPLKLEVGKTYILQYIHCKSNPFEAKITRITSHGYSWMEREQGYGNGIVSPNCYKLIREVIEKDYEILSLKYKHIIYDIIDKTDSENWKYKYNSGRYYLLLKAGLDICGLIEINSVKRLSDGKVFTVGDKVVHTNTVTNKNAIIESFRILSNGVWFKCNNYDVPMCYIKKLIEKPLLTTEDGVDIFEGDNVYFVKLSDWKIYFYDSIDSNIVRSNQIKDFSTKKAAEEYILMNKPCLSITDIYEWLKSTGTQYTAHKYRELEKFAKSKL